MPFFTQMWISLLWKKVSDRSGPTNAFGRGLKQNVDHARGCTFLSPPKNPTMPIRNSWSKDIRIKRKHWKNEWSWRISLIISLSHNKVLIYCFIFPWEWSGFVCLYYHGLPWTYTYLSRWKSALMRHWWVRIRSKWTLQTFVTKWIWQVFETLSSMSILLHKIVCAHIKQC